MTGIYLWENHVDKVVIKLLDILDTKQYGENTLLKVDYSLRVIIGETEKITLLCILFGMAGYLMDFVVAFGVVILLRTCTGGVHRKTILGCFLQSLLTLSIIVFLGKNVMLKNVVCVPAILVLVILILCFAPIQSENRIHYSEKQRMGFKVKALIRMAVVLLSSGYMGKELSNIVMTAVFAHMLEMTFLCTQKWRKEVFRDEA